MSKTKYSSSNYKHKPDAKTCTHGDMKISTSQHVSFYVYYPFKHETELLNLSNLFCFFEAVIFYEAKTHNYMWHTYSLHPLK